MEKYSTISRRKTTYMHCKHLHKEDVGELNFSLQFQKRKM